MATKIAKAMSAPKPAGNNRRRWIRFKSETASVILLKPESVLLRGRVEDESYGGLAIEVSATEHVVRGQEVLVLYYGAPTPAVIRRISGVKDGKRLVGLEWK